MNKKASMDTMNSLHAAVAKYYLDMLESGEELHGGTLSAINKFLKDNDISVDSIEANDSSSLQERFNAIIAQHRKEG